MTGVNTGVAGSRVVLVAADEGVRESCRAALEAGGADVAAVPTAEALLEAQGRLDADVVVVDLSLPGLSGIGLIHELLRLRPGLHCVVSGETADETLVVGALQEGALGVVVRAGGPGHLLEAVAAAAQGRRYIAPEAAPVFAEYVLRAEREPHRYLSSRELDVLKRIARGQSVARIAHALALSAQTVRDLRAEVRRKLGLRTGAELTEYVRKHGLLEGESA